MTNDPQINPTKIAIANYKGGVSKTAIATHLAVHANRYQNRILFIDMDSQRSSYSFFANEDTKAQHNIRKTWPLSSILKHKSLPGTDPERPTEHAHVDIVFMDDTAKNYLDQLDNISHLHTVMQPLISAADYEYSIIDCPAGMNNQNTAAMLIADYLVLPLQLSMEDYIAALDTFQFILDAVTTLNDDFDTYAEFPEILTLLPVRVKRGYPPAMKYLEFIRQEHDNHVMVNVVGERPVIPEATKAKLSIFDYKKGDPRDARAEMLAVTKEIMDRAAARRAAQRLPPTTAT